MPAPSVTRLARPAPAKSPRPRLLPRALVAAPEHDAHCRAVRPPIAAPPPSSARRAHCCPGPSSPSPVIPRKRGSKDVDHAAANVRGFPPTRGTTGRRYAQPVAMRTTRASTPWTDGTTRGKPLDGDCRGNVAARRLARFVRHIPRTQRGSAPSARSDLERGPITRPRGKPRIGCRGTSGPLFLRLFAPEGRKGRRRLTESEQGGSGTLRQAPTSAMTRLGSKSDAAGQCR